MTGIPKGLLIAAGVGAVGIGGYMLFKGGGDKKEGADPASKDVGKLPKDGAGAPGEAGQTPTAGTPAGGLPGAGAPGDAAAQGGAGAGGDQLPPGAQQVGPYTIIPDPQSGTQIVFETATKQPVGVLDAQGNLQPITMGPDGKVSVAAPTPGAGAGSVASSPMPGAGGMTPTGTTTAPGVPGATGLTAPSSQAAAGQTQYAQVAEALFAKAGDGSAGAASSDAMAGATGLVPAPTTATSTPTAGLSSVAPQPASTAPSGAVPGATSGLPAGARQVGNYTVIPDAQSGVEIVLDTASQQPVGVLDPATGKLVTMAELQAAQGGAATSPTAGTAAPMGATAPAPTAGIGAPAGAAY